MRQLRQPGDYLKNNRARVLPPHIHSRNQSKEREISHNKLELDIEHERDKACYNRGQLYTNHKREQMLYQDTVEQKQSTETHRRE